MRREGGYRFSLSFSCASACHVRAGEFLERMGNKKSAFVVGAVCRYLDAHPEAEEDLYTRCDPSGFYPCRVHGGGAYYCVSGRDAPPARSGTAISRRAAELPAPVIVPLTGHAANTAAIEGEATTSADIDAMLSFLEGAWT